MVLLVVDAQKALTEDDELYDAERSQHRLSLCAGRSAQKRSTCSWRRRSSGKRRTFPENASGFWEAPKSKESGR